MDMGVNSVHGTPWGSGILKADSQGFRFARWSYWSLTEATPQLTLLACTVSPIRSGQPFLIATIDASEERKGDHIPDKKQHWCSLVQQGGLLKYADH